MSNLLKKGVLVVLISVFLAQFVSAQITTYTDEGDFLADLTVPQFGAEETFDQSTISGTAAGFDDPLLYNVPNNPFFPAGLFGQIRVQSNFNHNPGTDNPRVTDGLVAVDTGFFGNPTKVVVANFFSDSFDIFVIRNGMTAISFNIVNFFGSTNHIVSVYDRNGGFLGSFTGSGTPLAFSFTGIIASEPIGFVNIYDAAGGGAEGADNIKIYGELPPQPPVQNDLFGFDIASNLLHNKIISQMHIAKESLFQLELKELEKHVSQNSCENVIFGLRVNKDNFRYGKEEEFDALVRNLINILRNNDDYGVSGADIDQAERFIDAAESWNEAGHYDKAAACKCQAYKTLNDQDDSITCEACVQDAPCTSNADCDGGTCQGQSCQDIIPECEGDQSRSFVGGPRSGACRDIDDELTCESSFHEGRNGFASCYWDGEDCYGCGLPNELDEECINECRPANEPAIICEDDPTRTNFVTGSGEGGGSCRQFDGDEVNCLKSFHLTGEGASFASCYYEDGEGDCRGCGPNNEENGNCVNTCDVECISDPSLSFVLDCEDVSLAQCENSFQGSGPNTASCYVDGSSCEACSEETEGCTNTCLSCRGDPSRDFVGPDSGACRGLDEDECEDSYHLGSFGISSCFWDGDQCRGCGKPNENNGECVNACRDCSSFSNSECSASSECELGGSCSC